MSNSSEGSLQAVIYALAANTGIAITKFVAAAFTGSGAMLAEAIHSLADCANQVLLLTGMKRAKRAPDEEHPMGYERITYFYAMLVGVLLFFVGGLFSVYHGVEQWRHPEPLHQPYIALIVLGVATLLESVSLWGAMREIKKNARQYAAVALVPRDAAKRAFGSGGRRHRRARGLGAGLRCSVGGHGYEQSFMGRSRFNCGGCVARDCGYRRHTRSQGDDRG